MPIPKNKQELYGKVIGANLNRGKSKKEAKAIAEAAVKPGSQRGKKKKVSRRKAKTRKRAA